MQCNANVSEIKDLQSNKLNIFFNYRKNYFSKKYNFKKNLIDIEKYLDVRTG